MSDGAESVIRDGISVSGIRVSPDGTRYAYVRQTSKGSQIIIAEIGVEGETTIGGGKVSALEPEWLMDSRSLVFTQIRKKERSIQLYNINTGTTENITSSPSDNYSPDVDSDGRILYLNKNGNNIEIFIIDLIDRNPIRLTYNKIQEFEPFWFSE